jgi:hypothetical protein
MGAGHRSMKRQHPMNHDIVNDSNRAESHEGAIQHCISAFVHGPLRTTRVAPSGCAARESVQLYALPPSVLQRLWS